MKIALAQIDCRLGDVEGACDRIADQARLASQRGADLLCVPSPLLTGLIPGGLTESADFERDLVGALSDLSGVLAGMDIEAVVPAVVAFEGQPLFEAFLLRRSRVIPLRTMLAHRREGSDDPWAPPVFDVRGTRVAVSFDALRDIEGLPSGCDVMVFFQSNALDVSNEVSAAVASVADGCFSPEVARKGVWLACMSPVGAFDDRVFCGGSFVMDDAGRVVAAAPCFEEGLVVQEISRGRATRPLDPCELPRFSREEWLWEGLRLHIADAVAARGLSRAAVLLTGDLPSSLVCALAVDALGPRNVAGVLVERGAVATPRQEAAELERVERVRALARNLGIRLVERSAVDGAVWMDRDKPASPAPWLWEHAEGLYLEDVAVSEGALAVSSITKTDAALSAPALAGGFIGELAPFGDVYLTELEFLARWRSAAAPAVPAALVTLAEVESCLERALARSLASFARGGSVDGRVAAALGGLSPSDVDTALEAHVDRSLPFEELPGASAHPEALAVLLVLVRDGELARRRLPAAPVVSGGSFSERAWPWSLAWSDTGHRKADAPGIADAAAAELERLAKAGEEHGARARSEVAGVIARSLGIPLEFLRGLDLGAADDGDDDDGEDGPAGSMGPMPGGMPFPIMPAPPTDGSHPGGSIFSDN